MNTVLRSVLLKEGVRVVLKNAKLQEKLIFHTIEFLDKDDKYKRLQIVYNQANVYFAEGKFLPIQSDVYSLVDIIRAQIKVYDTKEEFLEDKGKELTKEATDFFLTQYENRVSNECIEASSENFKVRSVLISWYPVNTIVIHYNYKRRRQQPLVILEGRPTVASSSFFKSDEEEYKKFIEDLCTNRGGVIWISKS